MTDKAEEWRWVGEDGVEKPVAEQELIAELSSESLPNYTLVWKKSWLEWLPAMQVAELAWALPSGKADDPVKPRERQEAQVPPAPPLYRYPVLKRRAANLRSDRPAPLRVRHVSPPRPAALRAEPPTGATPIEPETLIDAVPFVAPDPIAPLSAPSLESLSEDSHPSVEEVDLDAIKASDPRAAGRIADVSDAVSDEEDDDEAEEVEPEESAPDASPFGGFAPTDGGVAARAYGEDDEVETRVIRSKPPPPGPMYVGPHVPPAPERVQELHDVQAPVEEAEFPHIPQAPPPPSDLSAFAEARSREPEAPKKRPPAIYALGAVTVALAITVVVLLVRGPASHPQEGSAEASSEPEESAAPRGSAAGRAEGVPKAEPPPPKPIGKTCTVVTSATRVADWAEPAITPIFTPVPGSGRVAVGLGQSDVYAVGMTIDPRTLDRDQVFREYKKKHKLASVVPTTQGNNLKFQVTRGGGDLSNARAVDAVHLFMLGTAAGGIARTVDDGPPEVVWPLSSTDDVTVPRVATIAGIGFAATFRHGGKSGHVAVGWLDTKGRKKSELADIRTEHDMAGTPAIATNGDAIVVTFAARGAKDAAWKVVLATAKRNELPKKATPFVLPAGGPGGDAMSPSVAPLTGGRWLLQWTEGSTGNRVIRAAVLGKDLELVADPVNLSPDGANAGQGVSFSTGDLATILYYVRNDKKSNELWGASIDCTG